jgi:PAS domain S-box-containing protein
MLRFKLHTKFLVLVLGSLIAVLGGLSCLIITREASLLTQKSIEKQHALAFAIASNLQDNMIEGRPRRTLSLIRHLGGASGLVRLEVLRRDGLPAFGAPGARVTAPQLARTFATGKEVHYEEDGDPPLSTIIIPLKKERACVGCHKAYGPILGAVMVSLSREDIIRELAHSRRHLITLFSFIILLIGGLLYIAIRKVVLNPLSQLHRGAESLGKDGFSGRIDIRTDDEFQDLAAAFNGMAKRIEESYTVLECKVSERTTQLRAAMEDIQDKAARLYKYSRDMATISRLSTKAFNIDLSQDELLDRFLWEVTHGLRHSEAMFCLVDRERVSLDVKRDTGLGKLLLFTSQSLLSSDPLVQLARAGKVAVLESAPGPQDGQSPARSAFYVIPLLNRTHTKACWQITSCIKKDCPAYHSPDTPCWLVKNTLCGNPLMECFENKLSYCVTCPVFPVVGVLVVRTEPQERPLRSKAVSVLRILAAEMAAALENQRLHEKNQQMVRDLLELHRVTAAALSELSVQRALEVFTDSALRFAALDACAFWLVSSDGRELERRAAGGIDEAALADFCPERLPAGEGLVARALRERNFMIDYNVARNDTTPLARIGAVHGLNSLLAIPLKGERGVFGVFTAHKRNNSPFLETDIAAFMLLVNQAAMAADVCLLNDELKTQNFELARHTNLLSGILSSMSSGVMLIDENGTVLLVNQAGASLLQAGREDLVGGKLADLYPATAAFVRSQTGPYQEIEVLMPDGNAVPIGFSSNRYQGVAGEQQGIIVVFRDLSEVKVLEAELLRKERFAAMGRVVSGVAHEIRNPLFGISSVGQIFERELENPAHRELAGVLLSETRRMNQLVESLLLYSRPMKLNLEWCDLLQLWKEVIVLHRDELEQKGLVVSGELDHSHRKAYLDANQIRQVFLNLLRNSIDATPAGGTISIKVLLDDRFNVFRINDTGVGIPSADKDKIFDLFFTTKPKGTGLGLGICRKIVQDHGGDIIVESIEGKGTTVTVRLPYRSTTVKQEVAC